MQILDAVASNYAVRRKKSVGTYLLYFPLRGTALGFLYTLPCLYSGVSSPIAFATLSISPFFRIFESSRF